MFWYILRKFFPEIHKQISLTYSLEISSGIPFGNSAENYNNSFFKLFQYFLWQFLSKFFIQFLLIVFHSFTKYFSNSSKFFGRINLFGFSVINNLFKNVFYNSLENFYTNWILFGVLFEIYPVIPLWRLPAISLGIASAISSENSFMKIKKRSLAFFLEI